MKCFFRYLPSALPLAIHELDETQVGKFSFRGKATIMEVSISSNWRKIIFINYFARLMKVCYANRGVMCHYCTVSYYLITLLKSCKITLYYWKLS